MAVFAGNGSQAFRKFRRDLMGRGVQFKRTTGVVGAAASTPFTVAGLGIKDELLSVLYFPEPAAYAVGAGVPQELLTQTIANAVQATLTDTGAVSKLKFIAQSAYPGTAGNAISVAYVAGASVLNVVVSGTSITVNFVNGTNTVNDALNALKTNEKAMALVDIDLTAGTGTDNLAAMGSTSLSGGVDANPANVVMVETLAVQATFTDATSVLNGRLKYIAQSAYPGTKGNAITVQYVGGASVLNAVVSGTAIVVNFVTATTVGNDVLSLLKGNEKAMALVDIDLGGGDGTGLVSALGPTALSGGTDPSVQLKTPTNTAVNAGDTVQVDFLSRVQ